ncbi:MAG: glycosyltransferase [Hyphomicrobium sp.]
MRIVYISFLHPAMHSGGAQQLAYEMFEAALAEGIDAYFIAAVPLELAPSKLPNPGLYELSGRPRELLFVPADYRFDEFTVGNQSCIDLLIGRLRKISPDVVHFHHYHCAGVNTLASLKSALPVCRIIMHLHDMLAVCWRNGQMLDATGKICPGASPSNCASCNPEKDVEFFWSRDRVLLAAFQHVDYFVAPSEYLKRIYVNWGISASRILVVENGLKRPPGAEKLAISASAAAFGFFGQLLDAKGLDVLDRALRILADVPRRSSLSVEINGGNLQFASHECQQLVLSMHGRIRSFADRGIELSIRGAYSRTQLRERMQSVDWVIVPSTWGETFALVISEAWMFGRIPIVSRVGAMADRVRDNIDGVQFPVGDASALASVMSQISGNHNLHTRLCKAAPQPRSDRQLLHDHFEVYGFKHFDDQRAASRNI